MDDVTLAVIGVVLQVLCLMVAVSGLMVEVAALVLQALSKDKPRSSQEDEPDSTKSPNRRSGTQGRGELQLPAARLLLYTALSRLTMPPLRGIVDRLAGGYG